MKTVIFISFFSYSILANELSISTYKNKQGLISVVMEQKNLKGIIGEARGLLWKSQHNEIISNYYDLEIVLGYEISCLSTYASQEKHFCEFSLDKEGEFANYRSKNLVKAPFLSLRERLSLSWEHFMNPNSFPIFSIKFKRYELGNFQNEKRFDKHCNKIGYCKLTFNQNGYFLY